MPLNMQYNHLWISHSLLPNAYLCHTSVTYNILRQQMWDYIQSVLRCHYIHYGISIFKVFFLHKQPFPFLTATSQDVATVCQSWHNPMRNNANRMKEFNQNDWFAFCVLLEWLLKMSFRTPVSNPFAAQAGPLMSIVMSFLYFKTFKRTLSNFPEKSSPKNVSQRLSWFVESSWSWRYWWVICDGPNGHTGQMLTALLKNIWQVILVIRSAMDYG